MLSIENEIYDSKLKTIAASFLRGFASGQRTSIYRGVARAGIDGQEGTKLICGITVAEERGKVGKEDKSVDSIEVASGSPLPGVKPQKLEEAIKIPKETIEVLKNQVFGFDTFFITSQEPYEMALKTLTVIHRLLREADPTFREELLNFSLRGRILQLSNFKDDSSPIAWDCSAWVQTYALFLEERLECFRVLKYDIEAEHLPRLAEGQEKVIS
ncbi:hypothetical protein K1719_009216 [Acacia pycnantha]|nr:hypothetical protein K1719_009216 [Acacia pycnantha]